MTATMPMANSSATQPIGSSLSRRAALTLLVGCAAVVLVAPPSRAADTGKQVTLYRDPGCGCCESYVAYLRQNGFDVTVKSASPDALTTISRKAGIPPDLAGCHTAFIDGYAVDGLVPVAAVQKLLKDRPAVKGITLPGMPPGAPGMMGPKQGKLTVFAIPKHGKPTVFMTLLIAEQQNATPITASCRLARPWRR